MFWEEFMTRRLPVLFALGTVLTLGLRLGGEEEYSIPYDQLSPDQAERVRDVMDTATLSTEFEREEVPSSVGTYDFLLDRLPLTARMVRALDLGKYVIKSVEDEGCLVLDDREGVKVSMYEVFRGEGLRVYYTKGYYQGPLLPKIRGRGVIALKYAQEGDAIATSAKLWFRIDSGVARAMTKVFHPIVMSIAKDKGGLFLVAARQVAGLAAHDPEGFYETLKASGRFTDQELGEYRSEVLAETSANAERR